MKIAIVGSRGFADYKTLKGILDDFIEQRKIKKVTIISGGALGADALAERYAKDNGFPLKIFVAKWERYGYAAGPIRNKKIVRACKIVFAFWDGESRGTKSTLSLAAEFHKPVVIYNYMTKHLSKRKPPT